MFDLAALEAALSGTIFFGQLHFSPVTDSTNTDALEAARGGAAHGSVYFADEQLAGRGRGLHVWHSTAGEGLYVSVLLRPPMPAHRLPLLPLAAGLAAADAIRAVSGLEVDLRWPNDLLLSTSRTTTSPWEPQSSTPRTKTCPWGPQSSTPRTKTCPWGPQSGPRKTGGILVESKTEAGKVAFAVVGIGINVHQSTFAAGLATPATSLDLEARRRVSRQPLLISLLKSLERETLALLDPAAGAMIPARVEQASTWVRGRRVEVHGPQECIGVTAGLDEHGFLLVDTDAGLVTVQTGGIRAAAAVGQITLAQE
jgi:BirA family transcriptional regulator, biotin operon repressor / biotin---[acetyl-CoA-carboxylase] ligase